MRITRIPRLLFPMPSSQISLILKILLLNHLIAWHLILLYILLSHRLPLHSLHLPILTMTCFCLLTSQSLQSFIEVFQLSVFGVCSVSTGLRLVDWLWFHSHLLVCTFVVYCVIVFLVVFILLLFSVSSWSFVIIVSSIYGDVQISSCIADLQLQMFDLLFLQILTVDYVIMIFGMLLTVWCSWDHVFSRLHDSIGVIDTGQKRGCIRSALRTCGQRWSFEKVLFKFEAMPLSILVLLCLIYFRCLSLIISLDLPIQLRLV